MNTSPNLVLTHIYTLHVRTVLGITHQNQLFKMKYYSCNHLRLGRRLCHGRDHGAHLEWLPSSLGLVDKLHTVQASADVPGEEIDDLNCQVTAMREIGELPAYLQQVERDIWR